MGFYDDPMNQSVPTEANRGLTSYTTLFSKQERLKLYDELYLAALTTPIKLCVKKLEHSLKLTAAELCVPKSQLEKYETFKRDKTSDRRLMARGCMLGQEDATRLLEEEAKKMLQNAAKTSQAQYEDSTFCPEFEAAQWDIAVLNLAEAFQDHHPYCHVFWARQQRVGALEGMKWNARGELCGARKRRFNTMLTNITAENLKRMKLENIE
jgi:hypothetical protein